MFRGSNSSSCQVLDRINPVELRCIAAALLLGQTLFQSCHAVQVGPLLPVVGQDHFPARLAGSGQLHQHALESSNEFKIHRGRSNARQNLRESFQPPRLEDSLRQPGEERHAAGQGLHPQEPELPDVTPGTGIGRGHGQGKLVAAGVCLGRVGLRQEANGGSEKLLGGPGSLENWKEKEVKELVQRLLG